MNKIPVANNDESRQRPEWLSAVCAMRDHFANACFVFTNDDGNDSFFKFMFAVQNPLYIEFSQLSGVDEYLPMLSLGEGVPPELQQRPRWKFKVN